MGVANKNSRQYRAVHPEIIPFTAVVDPASAGAGAEISGTIAVAGAEVGDHVVLTPGVDLQTLLFTCYVSAADTVEWVLHNETAGAIDLASSTWKGYVAKYGDVFEGL